MKTGVYAYEDLLMKSSYPLSKDERILQREIKMREKEYTKFSALEGLCFYVFGME